MGRCKACNKVLHYPEDDAIVDKQGILCIECGEAKMSVMYSNCECGEEGVWFADNNASGEIEWYCAECEDNRSMKYGCALIISEGAMCQDGACGCNGTGVYS